MQNLLSAGFHAHINFYMSLLIKFKSYKPKCRGKIPRLYSAVPPLLKQRIGLYVCFLAKKTKQRKQTTDAIHCLQSNNVSLTIGGHSYQYKQIFRLYRKGYFRLVSK